MTAPTPYLPSLKYLPIAMAVGTVGGYLYGTIFRTNPVLVATICAVHAAAYTLIYHMANYKWGDGTNLQSQKICLITLAVVSMITIVALKELYLIGQFVSIVVSLAVLGRLITKVRYVQEQELLLLKPVAGDEKLEY